MRQGQPDIEVDKDVLFLLTGQWDDPARGEGPWLCADCCTMEGALLINPHWADAITIVRIEAARPRPEIIALLDEEHQNAPTLILAEPTKAYQDVDTVGSRRILTDPEMICRQLAACYGGARPQ